MENMVIFLDEKPVFEPTKACFKNMGNLSSDVQNKNKGLIRDKINQDLYHYIFLQPVNFKKQILLCSIFISKRTSETN